MEQPSELDLLFRREFTGERRSTDGARIASILKAHGCYTALDVRTGKVDVKKLLEEAGMDSLPISKAVRALHDEFRKKYECRLCSGKGWNKP